MSDFERDRLRGQQGGGWNSDTNMPAYLQGQDDARREAQGAKPRGPAWSGGDAGSGNGVVLLLGVIAVVAFVIAMRVFLVSLAFGMLLAGVAIHFALRAMGASQPWWRSLRSTAVAYGFGLVAAVGALILGALLRLVGLDLTPGLELFPRGEDGPISTGLGSILFPAAACLGVAAWRLNRVLPPTSMTGWVRWGILAALLVVATGVGGWLALAIF